MNDMTKAPGGGCACKRKAAGNDAAWGGKHFARALLDADASVVEKILHRIEEAKEALARRKPMAIMFTALTQRKSPPPGGLYMPT